MYETTLTLTQDAVNLLDQMGLSDPEKVKALVWSLMSHSREQKRGFLYGYNPDTNILHVRSDMPVKKSSLVRASKVSTSSSYQKGEVVHFWACVSPTSRVQGKNESACWKSPTYTSDPNRAIEEWFIRREEDFGYDLEALQVLHFKDTKLVKKSFPLLQAYVRGTFIVANSDRFDNMMSRGIGPHKHLGTGLIVEES